MFNVFRLVSITFILNLGLLTQTFSQSQETINNAIQRGVDNYNAQCTKEFSFNTSDIKVTYLNFAPYWCGKGQGYTNSISGFSFKLHNGSDLSINKMTYKVTLKNQQNKVLFSQTFTYNQNFHVDRDLELKVPLKKPITDNLPFNGQNHSLLFEIVKIEDYETETANYLAWYIKEKMNNCSSADIVRVFGYLKKFDPTGTTAAYKSVADYAEAHAQELEKNLKWANLDESLRKLWSTVQNSGKNDFNPEYLIAKCHFPIYTGKDNEPISKEDFVYNYDYYQYPFYLTQKLDASNVEKGKLENGEEYYFVKLDCSHTGSQTHKPFGILELRFQKYDKEWKLSSIIPTNKFKSLKELNQNRAQYQKPGFYRITVNHEGKTGTIDFALFAPPQIPVLYRKFFDRHVTNQRYDGSIFKGENNNKIEIDANIKSDGSATGSLYCQWGGSKNGLKYSKGYIYAEATSSTELVTKDKFYIALDKNAVNPNDFQIGRVIKGLDVAEFLLKSANDKTTITITPLDEKIANDYLRQETEAIKQQNESEKKPRNYIINVAQGERSFPSSLVKHGDIEIEIFDESQVSPEYRAEFDDVVTRRAYDETYIKPVPGQFLVCGEGKALSSIKMNPVKPAPAKRGYVYAMPNGSDPKDAVQKFIIVLSDNAKFGNTPIGEKFHLVGRVVSGLEVADKVSRIPQNIEDNKINIVVTKKKSTASK